MIFSFINCRDKKALAVWQSKVYPNITEKQEYGLYQASLVMDAIASFMEDIEAFMPHLKKESMINNLETILIDLDKALNAVTDDIFTGSVKGVYSNISLKKVLNKAQNELKLMLLSHSHVKRTTREHIIDLLKKICCIKLEFIHE